MIYNVLHLHKVSLNSMGFNQKKVTAMAPSLKYNAFLYFDPTYCPYSLCKRLFRYVRLIPDPETVVVDGLRRTVEQCRNLYGVVDAQTHQSKYTQRSIEKLAFSQRDPLLGAKKGIEVIDEIREYIKEYGIEEPVEFLQFRLNHGGGSDRFQEGVSLTGLKLTGNVFPKGVEFVDVVAADGEHLPYVFLLDQV